MTAKTLKELIVVSERYPAPGEPVLTFVSDLVAALSSLGVSVTVVSPQSLTRILVRGGVRMPRRSMRQTADGTSYAVLQPWYLSFSGHARALGLWCYRRAVKSALKKLPAPDAYYAHFWHSGVPTAMASGEKKVFVGCGESRVKTELAGDVKAIAPRIGGVISVSSKNKADCMALYALPASMIEVIPNAVDERVFHRPRDREALRRRLGIDQGDFAVAFVGWFDERKGVKRVEAALSGLEGVKVIYIGHGDLEPTGDNIAFKGRVEHDNVPDYLGAADVFLLPTRAEGCCNAIVEAMACGLPVVSSSGAFNDDLLSPDNSIRVDPDDVPAIRAAVVALMRDRERRLAMGEAAHAFAGQLTIKARAERIKRYIEERM